MEFPVVVHWHDTTPKACTTCSTVGSSIASASAWCDTSWYRVSVDGRGRPQTRALATDSATDSGHNATHGRLLRRFDLLPGRALCSRRRRRRRRSTRNPSLVAADSQSWFSCGPGCIGSPHLPLMSTPNRLRDRSLRIISTVSKPHPISNIRSVRYQIDPRQSLDRCRLEARRSQATVAWHEFWKNHNSTYNEKLQELKDRHLDGDIPSDEMSKFYAKHLNDTRQDHRAFNRWWIKENFALLWTGTKCWLHERVPDRKEPGFFGGH